MYHSPSPGGGGQWSNNPPSSQPPQWSPQPPPNGAYAPRPNNQVSDACLIRASSCCTSAKPSSLVIRSLFSFQACTLHFQPPHHLVIPFSTSPTNMAAIDPSLSSDPANANGAHQIPPISQAIPQQPAMATMQPQHPDQYRALPAPPQMYAPPYPGHPPMPYPPQPAPRQRTAIACRYCRRRKVCFSTCDVT